MRLKCYQGYVELLLLIILRKIRIFLNIFSCSSTQVSKDVLRFEPL